ncbi:MAG: hypothetical protein ACOZF0_23035 [Thermodesulfobacteriota bacterium]
MTQEKDIVLIYFEDKPAGFARVESIQPDAKKDWYHVKLLLLQIPLQTITWILKNDYINGAEYTMGGNRMRLERVVPPEEPAQRDETAEPETPSPSHSGSDSAPKGKVISLSTIKKR